MKDGARWYPRYPLTFLGGIQGLTAQQIAVYTVALELIYQHGGRINNDPKWLSGWISDMGPASVRKCIAYLAYRGLLTIDKDGITNKIAKIHAKTEEKTRRKREESGRKGGEISGISRSKFKHEYNEINDIGEASASIKNEAYKRREETLPDTSYLPESISVSSEADASSDTPPFPENGDQAVEAEKVETGGGHAGERASERARGAQARAPDVYDLSMAKEAFNEIAEKAGWPKVQSMSAARAAKLKLRIGDAGGMIGWIEQIRRAADSPFLCGENNSGWRAGFDFFLQSSSFTKLMEGSYDKQNREKPRDNNGFAGRITDSAGSNGQRISGPHQTILDGFAAAVSPDGFGPDLSD